MNGLVFANGDFAGADPVSAHEATSHRHRFPAATAEDAASWTEEVSSAPGRGGGHPA